MPSSFVRPILKRVAVIIAAAAALVLSLASSAQAQRTLPENVPRQRDPERQIRSGEIETERAQRDPQLILAEVNEDFGRLRVLDEEMKLTLKATDALDYKRISESAVEIRKRATRLKANLVFPPPPKDEKRPRNPDPRDDFRPLLAIVDRLLTSFLTNPIFTDTGALDVKLASRARYDLEDILKFSEKLRKSADKMDKQSGK